MECAAGNELGDDTLATRETEQGNNRDRRKHRSRDGGTARGSARPNVRN
jgi:hypothetical protein